LQSSDPTGSVVYAIEVTNTAGHGAGLSNQVSVSLAPTLAPPQSFAARVTSQGVVLSWKNTSAAQASQSDLKYLYRFYRRLEGNQREVLIGEIPVDASALTDSNIDWEKTYEYRAETVTVLAQQGKSELQIEGDDSPMVKVFADDLFPPAVPSSVQAVFSGAGGQPFIDLIWAPVPDLDLAGYNVYRRESGEAVTKINVGLVKAPSFRDTNVTSGKSYSYSVTAVDARGNESARSEEAGESVP
jgi:fibronectin type 3 domain-containing protein